MQLREIDLPAELERIRALGWIKSHRKGDTGIGKTVEDLLGIPENNLGEPDGLYHGIPVEIKGRRSKTQSMITLFTLEPGTRRLHDVQLIEKYGYVDRKGRHALKITLTPIAFTPQGLKLEIDDAIGTIAIVDRQRSKPWLWTTSDIKLKLQNLCILSAETTTKNGEEFFELVGATLLGDLNEKCFFRLLSQGAVKIDLRMHLKETGASRNHGTAFRLSSYDELARCYSHKEKLLT